jgi:hypothetical protein
MIEITLGGIDFDCEFAWVEDGDSSYAMLESARVKGVDISEVLSETWVFAIEDEIERVLKERNEDDKLDAELDRLEAYGI